jgi:hypothetical protein
MGVPGVCDMVGGVWCGVHCALAVTTRIDGLFGAGGMCNLHKGRAVRLPNSYLPAPGILFMLLVGVAEQGSWGEEVVGG